MSNEEIKALAREYAEEMIKDTDAADLTGWLRESLLKINADGMEKRLRWLLRRYALVEKEKVKAIRFRKVYSAEDLRSKFTEECLIDALFPDLGKEVEP